MRSVSGSRTSKLPATGRKLSPLWAWGRNMVGEWRCQTLIGWTCTASRQVCTPIITWVVSRIRAVVLNEWLPRSRAK